MPITLDSFPVERYVPIDDLVVRAESGHRFIEAYAAVFDSPQEIRDREGHYIEVIDRSAFDCTIVERAGRIQAIFNHGMTIHGTPSERYSMPYGTPEEIRPDGRGLFTRTRIANTELGAEIVELVDTGALRAMSFSALPERNQDDGRDPSSRLPIKRRMKFTLREYGLTPFPAYEAATVVALRSYLASMDAEQLRSVLGAPVPVIGAGSATETVPAPSDSTQAPLHAVTPNHRQRLAEMQRRWTNTPQEG